MSMGFGKRPINEKRKLYPPSVHPDVLTELHQENRDVLYPCLPVVYEVRNPPSHNAR
ncbi:unnamed protein product [Toxocara canis]|uniref:Uncharacterized protein n=1 Tax=Toxocara canis TaxID=6265 RepID=A0A3P7IJN9_TOXCA|nr:unnamed protein product [Toxocara canis]